MFSMTLKGLWAHKLRYALTGLAVVLAAAFMVGTKVVTDTTEQAFDAVFAEADKGTDVIVRRDVAIEGDSATARGRLDAGVVDRVAAVEGVEKARGSIQGVTQLIRADGTTSPTEGLGVAMGANWIEDDRLNPFSLSSGRAPRVGSEAVIDVNTAKDQGWAPGDSIRVLTKTGAAELTIVGTASFGALGGVSGSSLVATTDTGAQRLFADPGRPVIAGYPWFGDWGRDTMISLPGLALATGRHEEAAGILRTWAGLVRDGLLPNHFPEAGGEPTYN